MKSIHGGDIYNNKVNMDFSEISILLAYRILLKRL